MPKKKSEEKKESKKGRTLYELIEINPRISEGDILDEIERVIEKKIRLKTLLELDKRLSEDESESEGREEEEGEGEERREDLDIAEALALAKALGDPSIVKLIILDKMNISDNLKALILLKEFLGSSNHNGNQDYVARLMEKLLDKIDQLLDKSEKPLLELQRELLQKEIEELRRKLDESRVDPAALIDYILSIEEKLRRLAPRSDPRVELELARLELEREKLEKELELKKMELQWKLREHEERKKMISDILRRIAEVLPETLGMGGAQGERILARCPKCGELLSGAPGEIVRCPKCGSLVRIPGASSSGGEQH